MGFICRVEAALARIEAKIDHLYRLEKREMATLDDLKAQVQKNTDVEASAVVLIQGLAAQIAAAATDPVAIQALADQLKTSADSLAAAVAANTPKPPPAPPAP